MSYIGTCSPIKAMIIVAWNGSGKLSSIFEVDVFKKVLSIFITSAILNFVQGRQKKLILKALCWCIT